MAETHTTRPRALTDWIILIFVLVVMGLLIAEIADNVRDATAQPGSAGGAASAIHEALPA